jgi:thiol:disulfide interchange protein DsbC
MRIWLFISLCALSLNTALAGTADTAVLQARLSKVFPGVTADELKPSPMPGLYELAVGTRVAYVSTDGKYLFMGDMIDLEHRKNLTDESRGQLVRKAINGLSEKDMIVIGPKHPKRTITVFTDVDCPYCARLHKEVPELTANGVQVRYLLFPRNGIGSPTYKRSVAVWCAADRAKAIDTAISGGKLKMRTCKNPVAKLYKFGHEIGVRGTPAIVFDDGRIVPGYSPAPELLGMLGLNKTAAR